jgi:hypothetical protein
MRLASHRLPGLVVTDHEFEVPLDHADPRGAGITVCAREAIAGLRVWVPNEYEHDGSRRDGERVLGRLLDLTHGEQ